MHTRFGISMFLPAMLAAIGCAQDTGSLYGTVVDPGAGVVPNSQITATSAERGNSRVATSNQSGQWVLTLMPIGTYTVRIEAPGFKIFDRQGVSVGAEENVKIDLGLPDGAELYDI